MKRPTSKIAFTSDIIKEAAKELDMSTEKVQEVYLAIFAYLKHLTDNTNAVAIFIPHIGTLHLKVWYLHERLKFFKNNIKKLNIFKEKKKLIDEHIQEHVEKSYKGKSRHISKNSIDRLPYNGGKSLAEIEKLQNDN